MAASVGSRVALLTGSGAIGLSGGSRGVGSNGSSNSSSGAVSSLSKRWDAAVARNELLRLTRQQRHGLPPGSGDGGVVPAVAAAAAAPVRDVGGSSTPAAPAGSQGLLRRRPDLGLTKSNGHLDTVAVPTGSEQATIAGAAEETAKIRRGTRSESEGNVSRGDVALLRDELEANSHRLRDLEQQLSSSNDRLLKTEERLQKEQMNKTYLEAYKLDLLTDNVELRNRLQSVEKERSEFRDKLDQLQKQLLELSVSTQRKDRELAELRSLLAKGMSDSSLAATSGRYFGSLDRHNLLLRRKQTEVEKLKAAVERLMTENEIKERKLDELRKAVQKYQKVEEILLQSSAHGGGGIRGLSDAEGDAGSMSSVNDATSARAYHSSGHKAGSASQRSDGNSTLLGSTMTSYRDGGRAGSVGGSFSTLAGPAHAPRGSASQAPVIVHRSNSCEALRYNRITQKGSVESPPESRVRGTALGGDSAAASPAGFSSLPRDYKNKINAGGNGVNGGDRAASARGKDAYDGETSGDDDVGSASREPRKKRNSGSSGLKKIFARLKRSSSTEVVGDGFSRGGVRATAGPRLGGWSASGRDGRQKSPGEDCSLPFARWDGNQVADWLHDLGLSMYMPDCRRWVRCGQQLLDATPHAVEKELRITNALHRKKLLLAVDGMRSGGCDSDPDGGPRLPAAQFTSTALNLRPEWVTRWLDDVGLPQYKDHFLEARVDGRVLNFLTVDDLLSMKITNALHHASIRRGIEILRQNDFNLSSLKRRPLPEELADSAAVARAMSPDSVVLWTNHRIMEWLRTIDLSEYAPNLRGSGVHGGLVILEPRFTVEILADLLSIPAAKTLLRRHLASHFACLVGEEAMKKKVEAESNQSLPSLTLNGKVKAKKSTIFHKRSVQLVPGVDGELLCPIDDLAPIDIKKEDKKVKDAVAAYKKELTKRDHRKPRDNGLIATPQSSSTKC